MASAVLDTMRLEREIGRDPVTDEPLWGYVGPYPFCGAIPDAPRYRVVGNFHRDTDGKRLFAMCCLNPQLMRDNGAESIILTMLADEAKYLIERAERQPHA